MRAAQGTCHYGPTYMLLRGIRAPEGIVLYPVATSAALLNLNTAYPRGARAV